MSIKQIFQDIGIIIYILYYHNKLLLYYIFMIFFISSFEIINVLMADPSILLWIAASDAVNPNGIKTLLVNGSSTFSVKGK